MGADQRSFSSGFCLRLPVTTESEGVSPGSNGAISAPTHPSSLCDSRLPELGAASIHCYSEEPSSLLPEFVLSFLEIISISDLCKILRQQDPSPNNASAEKALPRALNPLPEKKGLKPAQMLCLTQPKQRNSPPPGRPGRVSASLGRSNSAEGSRRLPRQKKLWGAAGSPCPSFNRQPALTARHNLPAWERSAAPKLPSLLY